MWRTQEIGIHTFPIVWMLFSIRFPSYGILHYMGNGWIFLSNFPQNSKSQQNPSNGEGQRNWFSYFFRKIGVSFPIRFQSCSVPPHMGNRWVFSSISHSIEKGMKSHRMEKYWEIGYRKNPAKPIVCGELGKLVLIFFLQYRCFFPLDSHPMVFFTTWEMRGFSFQFLIARENAAKPNLCGLRLFFRSIIVSTCSKIW